MAAALELERTHYDAVIVGTGLTESIFAAALAGAGQHVLHIDANAWYGSTWASLSLRELLQWTRDGQQQQQQQSGGVADARYTPELVFPAFALASSATLDTVTEPPAELAPLDRHYALSLCPTLLPAAGATIDVLIRSGVASYCTFRMLEHTFVYEASGEGSSAGLKRVPSSKEDIFKDRSISLPDKRRLMKVLTEVAVSLNSSSSAAAPDQPFLGFLREKQGLSAPLATALSYGVALCSSKHESSEAALARMHTHLRSIGKYGSGAYLVGQYGGAGELAQGYCRCSAVNGGTYILGHRIRGARKLDAPVLPDQDGSSARWEVDIEGTKVTADWLVLDQDHDGLVDDGAAAQSESASAYDVVFGHVVLNRPFALPQPSAPSAEGDVAQGASSSPLPPETALVVFPPDESGEGQAGGTSTFVVMNGEGTFSTPKGQYVYYVIKSVAREDTRSARQILQQARDRILQLTQGAQEEWTMPSSSSKPSESSSQPSKPPTAGPLPPILEAYHRRRIPSPSATTVPTSTAEAAHLIRVPFPPPPPTTTTTKTITAAGPDVPAGPTRPALPNLASLLDNATALAESVFWTLGGGAEAKARAEAARKKVARRERDEEEFAGRAVALAGVREARGGTTEQGEEEETDALAVWDFFPKKEAQQDAD